MKEDNYPRLHVELVGCSNDPIEVLYSAFQLYNSQDSASETWRKIKTGKISRKTMEGIMAERLGIGYTGPLRQVQFIFVVENLSSACSALFNRQYNSIESGKTPQRYLDVTENTNLFITPPSFRENQAVQIKWNDLQNQIVAFYKFCASQGIQPEDARFALPLGTVSKEQFSMGFQTMQQFLDVYMCEKAPWEHREMAWQIFRTMKEAFPSLNARLGIKCWENRNLFCDETHEFYAQCKWSKTRPHKSDLTEMWRLNRKIS